MLASVPDPTGSPDEPQVTFSTFWTLYPRHEVKVLALKVWDKMSESDRYAAIVAIAEWRKVWHRRETETQFIPHARTWLNQCRWTDELPAQVTVSAASHVAFGPAAVLPAKAGELPAHVTEMLRKIRAGK